MIPGERCKICGEEACGLMTVPIPRVNGEVRGGRIVARWGLCRPCADQLRYAKEELGADTNERKT